MKFQQVVGLKSELLRGSKKQKLQIPSVAPNGASHHEKLMTCDTGSEI